jgi:hypothetical protein
MVFHDGRRGEPGRGWGVAAWAQTLVGALRDEVDPHDDAAGRLDRSKLADAAAAVQQVAGQLPALADGLIATVDRLSRTGRLYANARDLPPMEDMPEGRVRAVIAGRPVQARGTDLDRLRLVVGRTADLSTRLTTRHLSPNRVNPHHNPWPADRPQDLGCPEWPSASSAALEGTIAISLRSGPRVK